MREPFVGRAPELRSLSSEQPQATIVLGEPGAGKTRLLAEASAARPFWRKVSVACHRSAANAPLEPLLALARSLVRSGLASSADGAAVLSAVESDRMTAVREFLARTASTAPILIQIDDLQWMDAGSLDALWYCVERLQDADIRWHFAGRAGGEPMVRFAGELERSGLGQHIYLRELPRADFATLVALRSGDDKDADHVDRLYELTGGNPLYLEQLLAADLSTPGGLTPTLRVLLEDRIRSLPERALTIAQIMAVWGRTCSAGMLSRISGLAKDDVAETLVELEAAHIARGPAPDYAFRHELLRHACYRLVPQEPRAALHAALAGLARECWAHIHHLDGAGSAEEAARYLLRLGIEKIDRQDFAEAQAALTGALERDAFGGEVTITARGGLAAVKAFTGSRIDALALMQSFEDHAQCVEGAVRVSTRCRFAEAMFDGSDDCVTPVEYVERALAEAKSVAPEWSPRLYALAGALADRRESPVTALELLSNGLAECRPLTPIRDIVRLKSWLAVVQGRLGDAPAGLEILRDAIAMAEADGLGAEVSQCCVKGAYLSDMLGDRETYEVWSKRGLEQRGPRMRRVDAVLRLNLASTALDRGSLLEALGLAAAAVADADSGGDALRAQALCAVSIAHAMVGGRPEANEAIRRAQALRLNPRWTRAVEFVTARVAELGDDLSLALAKYRAVLAEVASSEVLETFDIRAMTGIVRVLYGLRRFAEIPEAAARLRDPKLPEWPLVVSLRAEAEGIECLARDNATEGCRLLLFAAETATERFRAATLRAFAGVISVDRALVNEALAEFECMGAESAAEQLRGKARGIGLRPRSRPRAAGEFTAAERRVAVLVGAGKTNAEIADQIGLSSKTVEHYVSSILSKRGLRSRVQLAAEVATGRLFRGTASLSVLPGGSITQTS